MPHNMSVILYVISCILSCDFNHLVYTCTYIPSFYDKKDGNDFSYVNKIAVCLYYSSQPHQHSPYIIGAILLRLN